MHDDWPYQVLTKHDGYALELDGEKLLVTPAPDAETRAGVKEKDNPVDSQNIVGKRFGRLVVTGTAGRRHANVVCLCLCDCGNKKEVLKGNLLANTRSCGCYNAEKSTKHGKASKNNKSQAYKAWGQMKGRCTNPKKPNYKNYGERGISYCDRWEDFKNFLDDMGEPAPGLSLDRINNDGNYEKDNCRWATSKQQCNNMRTNRHLCINGVSKTLSQWGADVGISIVTVRGRLARGWTETDAVLVPIDTASRNKRCKT